MNFNQLKLLLQNHQYKELKSALSEMNEVDIAQFLSELPQDLMVYVFRALDKDTASDVFAELPVDIQQQIILSITDQELSVIIEALAVDDAVDMLGEMPSNVVTRVLRNAKSDTRKEINQFLNYPDNSAGSVMTAEFTDLKKDMSVRDAIAHIRSTGEDRETIYNCYVIDSSRKLLGEITVKTLLLAPDTAIVGDLMETSVICVNTLEDQEEAARLLDKYNLLALPVVDSENRLVGIITIDDAVNVIRQETTEDFQVMAATAPSEQSYLKTSVWVLARNRIVWLLVLMISDMISGGILGSFEGALTALPVLITFIPMLTDTGGNAGSQASTLIIRGLALKEITVHDFFPVLWKEIRVAVLCGAVLSLFNYIRLIIVYPGQFAMAATVAAAMFCTVLMAKAIGGILPLIATRFKMDPALMASPLITTIVDAGSLLIYLNIAKICLHL
jgi:magnesium transporter